MRNNDHASSIIQTETEDENLFRMKSLLTETPCVLTLSLPISVNLEISAFMLTTSLRLSIILVNLRQGNVVPRCMIVASIAVLQKMMMTFD